MTRCHSAGRYVFGSCVGRHTEERLHEGYALLHFLEESRAQLNCKSQETKEIYGGQVESNHRHAGFQSDIAVLGFINQLFTALASRHPRPTTAHLRHPQEATP
jgi:hypothetical protein